MGMVYLIVGCFIGLDFVTGIIKALKQKNFNSSVMREGLYHKTGSVICLVLGALVDYAQTYIDLGITVPISIAFCVYISLMEIGSIIENVGQINPKLVPQKLREHFGKLS